MPSNLSPKISGISVVIPTINRPAVLLDTLKDLLSQEFTQWELIVIDQSESANEQAVRLLHQFPVNARYFKADFRGLPQARNYGFRIAQHDVILYIDDDVRLDSEFVGRHYAAHVSTGASLVAGGIDEAKGNVDAAGGVGSFNWWTATSVRNFHFHQQCRCLHAPGGNFSIKKNALVRVGGFDEALSIGAALYEETELALRMRKNGYDAWFEPTARLLHLAAPAGGCRVPNDWPRYISGLAHNRAILIYRHLHWWNRPTALARLAFLALSYCRLDGSVRPIIAAIKGLIAGRRAAKNPPRSDSLSAEECTTC